MSILTDSKEYLKMVMEVPDSMPIGTFSFCIMDNENCRLPCELVCNSNTTSALDYYCYCENQSSADMELIDSLPALDIVSSCSVQWISIWWDEPTSIVRSERVYLWETDTYRSHVPTSLVQPLTPKNKRARPAANNLIIGNMRKIPASVIVAPKGKWGRRQKLVHLQVHEPNHWERVRNLKRVFMQEAAILAVQFLGPFVVMFDERCMDVLLYAASYLLQTIVEPPAHFLDNYHKENVNYADLIWEDFQYQIDNRQSKVRRRDIMPYPRFTKIIIHYFLSKHYSISKRQGLLYNTSEDDGVFGRLKFISKGEEHQVYGKPIPDILQSSITADDNILQDPDEALKLGKSVSKTEANLLKNRDEFTRLMNHQSGGSSKGASIILEVLDEPIGKFAVSDEGAGISPEVPDETKDKSKADEEQKEDEEKKEDDQAEDDQVWVPVLVTNKENPDLLHSTSSQSISSNFGNQFLNNSFNVSLIGTIQENAEAEINSLLDIKIQQEVPTIQQEPFHEVKVVSNLDKNVKELKQIDHILAILESIKSQVQSVVDKYPGSSLEDTLQKVLQRHTEELIQRYPQKDVSESSKNRLP
ncbi:hypothetical protein Tco_0312903 [Tanacetum coccineum]